jgi:lysozyme family protein
MKETFAKCLEITLGFEGGVSNHPKDPGGLTNKGVTQRVYDAYRKALNLSPRSVKLITKAELLAIYRKQYWMQVCGDDLPAGVDLVVFDYAVNSGAARAIKDLQRVVGVNVDAVVGEITLQAISSADIHKVINGVCDKRYSFMRKLKTWPTFGRGWTARVAGVRSAGLEMVGVVPSAVVAPVAAPAKAIVVDEAKLKTPEGAGGTILGAGAGGQAIINCAQQVQPHIAENLLGRCALTAFIVLMAIGGILLGYSYMVKIKESGGLGGFIGSAFRGQK